MLRQFTPAPEEWEDQWPRNRTPRSKASKKGSRLFKVRINSAGCDHGGIWHVPSDLPLWCLRTANDERFVRANSRDEAAKLFGVTDLARKS